MGLFRHLKRRTSKNIRRPQDDAISIDRNKARLPQIEIMEQRQMLSASPLQLGAVYIEEDSTGGDQHGDTFELSFLGGAPGTQLTRLVISGDQVNELGNLTGFSNGDVIFDTVDSDTTPNNLGYGADFAFPLTILSQSGIDEVLWKVVDGSTELEFDFQGFESGDKLTFSIDVDEVISLGIDPSDINAGIDPLTSGVEFQSSILTAEFQADHYFDHEDSAIFLNRYDSKMAGTGLDLPLDNQNGNSDRTAGAFINTRQVIKPVTISGTVYHDWNLNLQQSAQEPGISNVSISLWKLQNNQYEFTGHTTTTDSQGNYLFGAELDLKPGTYQIRETQPLEFDSVGAVIGTVAGSFSGEIVSGNPDQLTNITIPLGDQHAVDYDFAESQPVNLQGWVYYDRDNDGEKDPGEEGISSVEISLVDALSNQVVDVQTTDQDGSYEFSQLMAGTYHVIESHPSSWIDGKDSAGTVDSQTRGQAAVFGDEIRQVVLGWGDEGINFNFGEIMPASLSGYVYHDRDNDGEKEAGEEGLAGVQLQVIPLQTLISQSTVQVVTDINGFYQVTGISPGTYRIVESNQPSGFRDGIDSAGFVAGVRTGTAVNPGDAINGIAIAGGQSGEQYNFGEYQAGSIRGRVHLSTDDGDCFSESAIHEPVVGATVLLQDHLGNLVAETVTDINGEYEFLDLDPGNYTVIEITPQELIDGGQRIGTINSIVTGEVTADDTISNIVLTSGRQAVNYDFCEHLPAMISGSVYHDENNDGVRNASETGIEGVEVLLLDADGIQVGTSQVTDANGSYSFSRLIAGEYTLVERHPDGWTDGIDRAGTVDSQTIGQAVNPGDEIRNISLLWGDQGVNYDFGEFRLAGIRGNVHLSTSDGDCFGENIDHQGVSGARVILQDAAGNFVAETLTDDNGDYRFDALLPGTYTIVEITPPSLLDGGDHIGTITGIEVGRLSGNDTISDIVITSGRQAVNYDFCEHAPVSLSGSVYHDENNNGVRDSSETGILGVEVILLDAQGIQVGVPQITKADGSYSFERLSAGDYTLVERHPNGWSDGIDQAGKVGSQVVGQAVNPGDEIRNISLLWGDEGVNYDFGEFRLSGIEGNVHFSTHDGDCFGEDVNHQGIAGVRILLQDDSGNLLDETLTDENGDYRFDGILPGSYTIVEITPAALIDGGDHIGSINGIEVGRLSGNDVISDIEITSGSQALNYDFCEHAASSLFGFVFHDENNNGILEPGETGIPGVEVILLDDQGNQVGNSQTTDSLGVYRFNNLRAGSYSIVEVHPQGWFDGIDAPGTINSNVVGEAQNPGDRIQDITLLWGDHGVNYFFGEFLPSSLSGRIHADTDGDCELDSDEELLENIPVFLLDQQGSIVDSTLTDDQGSYRFDGILPGTYSVQIQHPDDYFHGGQEVGSGDGESFNDDEIRNITINSGTQLTDYNFCEIPASSISGYVFQDGATLETLTGEIPTNIGQIRNGLFTNDDTPLAGVVLELRNGITGDSITADEALPGIYPPGAIRVMTDATGFYEFRGLAPNNYAVFEIHPDGYIDSLDTPGSTSGIAINPQDTISPFVLSLMTVDPANDAIIRIPLPAGVDSTDNNFSEIRIDTSIIPEIPPETPELPPLSEPPVILVEPVIVPELPAPTLIPIIPMSERRGGTPMYTWHLSVIDAGMPRENSMTRIFESTNAFADSYMHTSLWNAQYLSTAHWILEVTTAEINRTNEVRQRAFGMSEAIPITGDFNGDGLTEIGVFYKGEWFIDLNGNGIWDPGDLWAKLGHDGDSPVTGDWDGDGKDDIGIFGPAWPMDILALQTEPGLPDPDSAPTGIRKNIPRAVDRSQARVRSLKLTSQGNVRQDLIDHVFHLGNPGQTPISGDWNGDGIDTLGLFQNGQWYLDVNGDGHWSEADRRTKFGKPGDRPIVDDFNGDGIDEIGVFRAGKWILDTDGDLKHTALDKVFEMGTSEDVPVTGDWDGDGVAEIGVFKDGTIFGEQQVRK